MRWTRGASRIASRRVSFSASEPSATARVDAREVLRHDRARAEVEMADLGVAHLALGQADRLALGGELRVRVRLPQPVEHGGVGERDGVPRPVRGEAPSVEDDEGDVHRRAASTIAAKLPASRLAPPTSAPSTSGSESSSAALSGFSDPP